MEILSSLKIIHCELQWNNNLPDYTTSATLNMSPVFEIIVEGVSLKEQNISSITIINATTYDIKSIKKRKLFGIIPIDVDLKIRIDSDTYKVINMEKPWWTFLTT